MSAFLPALQFRRSFDTEACIFSTPRCTKAGIFSPRMTAVQPQVSKSHTSPQGPIYDTSSKRLDYLELVLTSRVYDVVTETPLEEAPLLSSRIKNKL
eukprot:IDg5759t1